jgi:DMSO reductase family type II enzyme heme b subunit
MEANSRRALIGSLPVLALAAAACGRKAAVSAAEVVAVGRPSLPKDPLDPAWDGAVTHPAALILQDMVEPRLLAASTPEVRVKAISDGANIAFRLEWDDAEKDDRPGPARFCDACAVQLPALTQPDVPAPQMGEAGRTVEIVYWRASWQATIDGRGDTIRDLEPTASIDHYPFQAAALQAGSDAQREMEKRYAPARAVGNTMSGPRSQPVEDLIAEGPGTLSPAPASTSTGSGKRLAKGWAVVFARRLPTGLTPGGRTQVAFAVWQGSRQEVGPRKMRTPWIPMALEARP